MRLRTTFNSFALLSMAFACLMGADRAHGQDARQNAQRAREEFFEARIRPALVEHCYACHSLQAEEVEGELMLDNRAAVAHGGQSGKVIVPGDPDRSLLIQAIRFADDGPQMPPDAKLPAQLIQDFEKWVRDGAFDPRDGEAPTPAGRIKSLAEEHWAFAPPQAAKIPNIESDWPRDDIDRLVAKRLSEQGIPLHRDADRRTWLRRVTFDLTGLPPTYEQVQAFQADQSQQAFESVVDRLLKSPHFGERWARHWLDLARFGDTKGYDFTKTRDFPNAFKYRDWVIKSFNEDLPYNRFLQYQLAADLLEEEDKSSLAALGYVTLGRRFINNKHDIIDDRIDVVFRGMMGLTVTCARCHDHKYDPISSQDYYSLYGVFDSCTEQQDKDLPLRLKEGRVHDVRVFLRGKPSSRGDVAPRRFLSFFSSSESRFRQGSGRGELAKAIIDPKNPLTARVFVNRVWGHLFDQPIVTTPSDFGLRSQAPVQRDVLDHLAHGFVEDKWSVKRLIRRLVLSSTYRQSSQIRLTAARLDPENLLLSRMPRRRLDFEAMRDAVLEVGGGLDHTVGGPSVKIATDPNANRRALYAYIDRQNLPDLFRTFDFASPDTHSPRRAYTTSPQQSLFLMNNAFAQQAAGKLAERSQPPDASIRTPRENIRERIRRLYLFALARQPDSDELTLGESFIDSSAGRRPTWTFGYGDWLHEEKKVEFRELLHLEGSRRQAGAAYPDPKLGYVGLHPQGGHPGEKGAAAIRRWTAPRAGQVTLMGRLKHPSEKGDGVRGRVVLSPAPHEATGQNAAASKVLGEWAVKNSSAATKLQSFTVQKGQTIDLIVDCREHTAYDSFQWPLTIFLSMDGSSPSQRWEVAKSLDQPDIDPWTLYAQTLLMSNEFHFLD